MGKISTSDTSDKGFISKIYKELIQLNTKKTPHLIKKWEEDLNRHLIQKRHTDGQYTYEKCSTSLIIRKMQIKATMRYHLTPVRITVINKSTNDSCCEGCGEKGTLVHY